MLGRSCDQNFIVPKKAFQTDCFKVSMIKIGAQTTQNIDNSLRPIQTVESESRAGLFQNHHLGKPFFTSVFLVVDA